MRLLIALLLTATLLAGCADGSDPDGPDGPRLDVTDDTGGIRGVVVDQSIVPVVGATVSVRQTDQETTTDEGGQFTFIGLEPGTYFLDVSKNLYDGVQASVEVVAGVAEPKLVQVQLTKLTDAVPFVETIQFDGFYECAFAAHGVIFRITDSCDFGARTVHDEGVTVVPRNLQNNVNTQFHPFTDSMRAIVQEGFWDTDATPFMWMFVDSTPIDNACDCSDHTYVEAIGESPTYGRADIPAEVNAPGNWPMAGEDVAIRGFIPFPEEPGDVQYAVDVQFQIFTSFFHHHTPAEGWNFSEKDQYPVPQ